MSDHFRRSPKYLFLHGITISLCLFLSLTGMSSALADDKPLVFAGDENIPPFEYIDHDGHPAGYNVELTRQLSEAMGRAIEIKLMRWDEAQRKVLEGEIDAVTMLGITEKRKELYDFSEPTIKHEFAVFIKSGPSDIRSIIDLQGKTIGVTRGGLPAQLLGPYPDIKLVFADDNLAGFNLLLSGEIDAFSTNRWAGAYTLHQEGIKGITSLSFNIGVANSAFAVKKGNVELQNQINAGLSKLRQDGILSGLEDKWQPKRILFLTYEKAYETAAIILLTLLVSFLWAASLVIGNKRLRAAQTRLKEAELAAQIGKKRYAAIHDHAQVPIVLVSSDGIITEVNEAWERLFACPREKAIGKTALELGLVRDPERRRSLYGQIQQKGFVRDWEMPFHTLTGAERLGVFNFDLIEIGGAKYHLGTAIDITERRKAEEALQHLNQSLERKVQERTAELHGANQAMEQRAAQLRALAGQLASAEQRERKALAKVLHDGLQQYLVAARMRQEGLILDLEHHPGKESAQQVESLLSESINVSRALAAELCPPALDSGICAGLEWLSRFMASKHGLDVNLVMNSKGIILPEEIKVFLFESVRELLLNVVKHTKVRTAKVVLQEEQTVLKVIVSDTGSGVDVCALQEGKTGTGFGLFSMRERIGLIGGAIEIDSSPGEGSRFTLIVPVDKAVREVVMDAAGASCDIRPGVPSRQNGLIRILLADDHKVMRESLAQMLQAEEGFEIVGQAEDGNMAVELSGVLRPDIVLMDINMPIMDGITATRIITKQYPEIRVIGLSFHSADYSADEIISAGAMLYVSKTAPADELKKAIRLSASQVN